MDGFLIKQPRSLPGLFLLGVLLSTSGGFWAPAQALYSYSFQYENLLLLDFAAGFSNLATPDSNEVALPFAFSTELGLARSAMLPQGRMGAMLVLRNNYLLHFQVLLSNLRNQQGIFAFGLGNETRGLLFGVAQEFTLLSESRPNTLGLGVYTKLFYGIQGLMDLQFEGRLLTNTLSATNINGYSNIYMYIQALFMISQLRIGIRGTLHLFNATATGPSLIQLQGKLVFGGSAGARLLDLDFYLSAIAIVNQGLTDNNYSIMFFGAGFQLNFVLYRRITAGAYLEVMSFPLPLSNVNSVQTNTVGLSFGLTLKFRIFRKELWSPEVVPLGIY